MPFASIYTLDSQKTGKPNPLHLRDGLLDADLAPVQLNVVLCAYRLLHASTTAHHTTAHDKAERRLNTKAHDRERVGA
jgi:hypothetical protein